MKNYEKPIVEVIDLTPSQSIMNGTVGDGPSVDQGIGEIPGLG